MDKVRVFYDAAGQTLCVWLDDPALEHSTEEADDDTVVMKDIAGRIIGFEKLNVSLPSATGLVVEMSTQR